MFCFDLKKRVLYSPFVYLFDQLRGSCDIFGGQCRSKEARMAEQYILNMEEGQIQREMPILWPYDVVEYRGIQQSPAPTRSIVDRGANEGGVGGGVSHPPNNFNTRSQLQFDGEKSVPLWACMYRISVCNTLS